MANELNKFNINTTTFNIVDTKSRELISELDEIKADKFEALSPLSFDINGNLTINLDDYYTSEALDNLLDEKFNEINSDQNIVYEKIDSICNILKVFLGENNIINEDNNISFVSDNIPSLENITESINNLNTSLQTLNTSLNENIYNLNISLNNRIDNLDSELTENLNDKETEIQELKNRCKVLENEVFYFNGVEPSDSKIEEMYKKVEKIYEALERMGLVTDN